MKKLSVLFIVSLLLVGCNAIPGSQTVIDWVDFVNVNGKEYDAVYTAVIADPTYIEEKIGEVKFKVADNVTNPGYRVKDGDAAFWKKGTKIFRVKDREDLIAIKDENEINGYRIYHARAEDDTFNFHFQDINLDTITKVELYEGYTEPTLLNTIDNQEEITDVLRLLNESEVSTSFSPNTSLGDPRNYQIVLYTDEVVAYHFTLYYDGQVWFWHPWETSIISNDIESYIKKGISFLREPIPFFSLRILR